MTCVVRHETVGPDFRSGAVAGLRQEIDIEGVVTLLEEGCSPAVAALGDMMGHAGDDDTGETGHERQVALIRDLVNCHRNSIARPAGASIPLP